MIFNQLFDNQSSTYTYIISSGKGREALIIDPVIEHSDEYIKVLENLELKLVKVIDTHIHADHITGLNELNKRTNCTRIMGEKTKSEVIDLRVKDSEKIEIENIKLEAIYTPGHTDCSYCYLMNLARNNAAAIPNWTTAKIVMAFALNVFSSSTCFAMAPNWVGEATSSIFFFHSSSS